jgi:hypothetical protein
VQLFNVPAARSGAVLTADQGIARLGFDVANNFTDSHGDREFVLLDGESRRVELGFSHGLGNGWEIGVALPWIDYRGGSLDRLIEDWHDAFGLPDGDRADSRRDRLDFRYARDGIAELDFNRSRSGIGDVQVHAAYSLLRGDEHDVALTTTLNLPTGDAEELTGADASNVGVSLAATQRALFGLPLTATGNIGAMWMEQGEVLGGLQKDVVWFGAAELGWAIADAWRLKLQVNAHSAFYDSELRELGDPAVQLLLGGSVRLAPRWYLDVAVGEDIAVNTAPDVTFQLALKAAL